MLLVIFTCIKVQLYVHKLQI